MDPPWIIAVDTSGPAGSVVLARGARRVEGRNFAAQTEHARELLPAVDGLCRSRGLGPGDLAHCYLSIGPGSFTGLRVAVTFARHLAWATGVRLCAVNSLDVIADHCADMSDPPPRLGVLLHARRDRVFAARFEYAARFYRRLEEPRMVELATWLASAQGPLAVVGEGAGRYRSTLEESGVRVLGQELWTPRADSVHRLGWRMAEQGLFMAPRELVPCYIRRPEAEEVWERRTSSSGG